MAARPTVKVQSLKEEESNATLPLPFVFSTQIRRDVVKFAVSQLAKNSRQPHGVSRRAGHKHSAESWHTGRAVARIPRVSGGGTHASGAAAFGNMCRGGHMFAGTKVFRRWNVRVPRKIRRAAICSAIAASASTPIVEARGHKVKGVKELPLVVSDAIESINKAKAATKALEKLGLKADLERVADSINMRAGKGKWRGRRYVTRKGPLVVLNSKSAERAFRNIPGVDAVSVSALNVLKLAPGGHLGRLIVWSESAFKALDAIYGTDHAACPRKSKFRIPRPIMQNGSVTDLINRGDIQTKLRAKRTHLRTRAVSNANPLTSRAALKRLCPLSPSQKASIRATIAKQVKRDPETHKRSEAGRTSRRRSVRKVIRAFKAKCDSQGKKKA